MYYKSGGFGNCVVVVDGGDGGRGSGGDSGRCRFTGICAYICIYIYTISMPIAWPCSLRRRFAVARLL